MDGSQKERDNILNLLQKEWVRSETGGSNTGGTIVKHILKLISISHCLDISYVFLYLIFRPFIFIDSIKTITLFITFTLYNHFMFIFNLEKVQSYKRNNSIQAGKVNGKL